MPDFINEFTDHLRGEFILHREHLEHARTVLKNHEAMTRHDGLASYTWDVLYWYYETVLKMKRYQTQRRYAAGILRELNEPLFEGIEKATRERRRRRRKPPEEGTTTSELPFSG